MYTYCNMNNHNSKAIPTHTHMCIVILLLPLRIFLASNSCLCGLKLNRLKHKKAEKEEGKREGENK